MFWGSREVSDGHLIATFLPFLAYFLIYQPDKGVKPEYRLGSYLQQIDRGIASQNVAAPVGARPILRTARRRRRMRA